MTPTSIQAALTQVERTDGGACACIRASKSLLFGSDNRHSLSLEF
jgi:hypothetical protein